MELYFNNNHLVTVPDQTIENIKPLLQAYGLQDNDFYLVSNGKILHDESQVSSGKVHVILRLRGGKGGFGSMLRAIGAQIEKTTNREACRDLSGRRLRDINEEQRLKNWIAQQADREREELERKQKKLERLCERPKHEFKDEEYDKQRAALPDMVEDAVLKGLEASASYSTSGKRKGDPKATIVKKKAKLWIDDDLDEDFSSSDDESTNDNEEISIGKTNEDKSEDSSTSEVNSEQQIVARN